MCCLSQAQAWCKAGRSSRSGIRAMLSAKNMRRPTSCQCSFCSSNTAPTRRMIAVSLGKMPKTLVRGLISSLTRSSSLVLQIFFQRSLGKWRSASMLGVNYVGAHYLIAAVQLRQRGGQMIPERLDFHSGFLSEHAAQGRLDHALMGLGDALQLGASKKKAIALPLRSFIKPCLGRSRKTQLIFEFHIKNYQEIQTHSRHRQPLSRV